jgi:hypothetical protein
MVTDADSIRGHFLGIARRRRLGVCRNDFPTNIYTRPPMEKTSFSLGQGGIANVGIESCVCAAVYLALGRVLFSSCIQIHLGLVDWLCMVSDSGGRYHVAVFGTQTRSARASTTPTIAILAHTSVGSLSSLFLSPIGHGFRRFLLPKSHYACQYGTDRFGCGRRRNPINGK